MRRCFQFYQSPIGELVIVAEDLKLEAVIFKSTWPQMSQDFPGVMESANPITRETVRQFREYFAGTRKEFALPFEIRGTPFAKRTLEFLSKIPFGETRTYREQAASVSSPKASRAVGRVNGSNKLCVILPCHRVIGSNGTLTGYAGGIGAKEFLLKLEGIEITSRR